MWVVSLLLGAFRLHLDSLCLFHNDRSASSCLWASISCDTEPEPPGFNQVYCECVSAVQSSTSLSPSRRTWRRWRCLGCGCDRACWGSAGTPGPWSGLRSCWASGSPGRGPGRAGECCAAGTPKYPGGRTQRRLTEESETKLYVSAERHPRLIELISQIWTREDGQITGLMFWRTAPLRPAAQITSTNTALSGEETVLGESPLQLLIIDFQFKS